MLTPLSSVLSLGNKVPIVVSFAPLGLQYWPALHPCRSLPHYCQLCLTSDICPVPTEQYLSLPHPGNSCKSLSPPVAPQLPLSFGSKMGGMSKPWPLFPAWPNPTSPPILEKKVGKKERDRKKRIVGEKGEKVRSCLYASSETHLKYTCVSSYRLTA